MYGLPHAGRISQDGLIERLASHGYMQTGTTCLFISTRHQLCYLHLGGRWLRGDDLIRCLRLYYEITIKKNPTKYLGITIAVDKAAREVRMSAPGVIAKALKQFAPLSTTIPSWHDLAVFLDHRSPSRDLQLYTYHLDSDQLLRHPILPIVPHSSLWMIIIAYNVEQACYCITV